MMWLPIAAAFTAAFTAAAASVTAYASLRNSRKNSTVLGEQTHALEEIHIMVNSRLDAMLARVDQLTATLEHADVTVPPDPADTPDKLNVH